MLNSWLIKTLEQKYTLRILSTLQGCYSMDILELTDTIKGEYKVVLSRIKEMESVGLIRTYKVASHDHIWAMNTPMGEKIIRRLLDGVEGW